MTLRGIDVSQYQGAIDWEQVRGCGIAFAFARCERERDDIDPTFEANVAAMREVGILPGAYCFLKHGIVAEQASHYIAELKKLAGPSGFLCALDVAAATDGSAPTLADVKDFAADFKGAFPAQPLLLYGSKDGPLGTLGPNLAKLGPLWLADYAGSPAGMWYSAYVEQGADGADEWRLSGEPWGGWTEPALWQFSTRGRVPGITGDVDLNASRASLEGLRALAGIQPRIYTQAQYDAGIRTVTDRYVGQIGVLEGRIGTIKGKIAGMALDVATD